MLPDKGATKPPSLSTPPWTCESLYKMLHRSHHTNTRWMSALKWIQQTDRDVFGYIGQFKAYRPSHLPPGDIRSFFCASDHQFSRHRRQRRRTRRCESDSPLVADATSTSPPARSSPQPLPPATKPSSLSAATTSLYDANAQIAPPSIREPSNGSDIHNSEHEGRGGPNPLTNQQREGRGRGAGLEREPD